jgi:hypothetical protein
MNRRSFVLGAGAVLTTSLLAGCTTATTDDDADADDIDQSAAASDEPVDDQEADDPGDDDQEPGPGDESDDADATESPEDSFELPDDFEPFDTPEIDLETLSAELPDETMDVEPWANTWVGEVTEDLFIGIRIADSYGDSPREVSVYMCDGEDFAMADGELVEGEASLSGEDVEVEFTLVDDEITGTVTLEGAEQVDFSAYPATDDAGVYVGVSERDELVMTGRWVVLPDGRQRGILFCCPIVTHLCPYPCGMQR